jgi:hypothetical protein
MLTCRHGNRESSVTHALLYTIGLCLHKTWSTQDWVHGEDALRPNACADSTCLSGLRYLNTPSSGALSQVLVCLKVSIINICTARSLIIPTTVSNRVVFVIPKMENKSNFVLSGTLSLNFGRGVTCRQFLYRLPVANKLDNGLLMN